MKRVAIFTTFFESESGYSLIGVAETQIKMLLDNGYDPIVLVQRNWQEPKNPGSIWRPELIDLRPVLPPLTLEQGIHPDFDTRSESVLAALRENLADAEVVITHDIMLQRFYKEHNVATRRYAGERPDLLWLHYLHSCPTPGNHRQFPESCRYTPPPGYIVYPNYSDIPQVVRTYDLAGQEWRVMANRASHAIDPLAIWNYDPLTKALAQKADLLGGDVSVVFPARLDKGKQPEKIIRVAAGIAKAGHDPRLLIIDWQSMGKHFQQYMDELLGLAKELGIEGKVNFTSRLDDRCSQGAPRQVVTELMDLSNVYIHPSAIETYSFTVHEAMLRGCLCVLNHDLPMMHELYGPLAMYMDFGSDRYGRNYWPDEQTFFDDEAKRLLAELSQNRSVQAKTQARKHWNPAAMWKTFEPLLYLEPK